jgi:hypothetical protein
MHSDSEERKVSIKLSRVPSRTRLRGRLFVVHSEREGNTPQFLLKVFAIEGSSPGSIRRSSHHQAIKALRVGPLHSHLVREQPKTVPELYEQFTKFSKSEIQHFRKFEQLRKISKPDNIRPSSPTNHIPNAKQQPQVKSEANPPPPQIQEPQQQNVPNTWYNPCNHRRLQYQLSNQATTPRLLQRSKSYSCQRPHYSDHVVPHSHNLIRPRYQPNLI